MTAVPELGRAYAMLPLLGAYAPLTESLDFTATLPVHDRALADTTLDFVTSNLKDDGFCMGGGLVTRYYLAQRAGLVVGRPFHDVDILTASPDSILPSMFDRIALTHFHHPDSDDRHYIAGIDRETGIVIDFFTWLRHLAPEPLRVPWHDTTLPITTLEEECMAKVWEVNRNLLKGVKKSLLKDVILLSGIADWDEVEQLWSRRCRDRIHRALGTFALAQQVIHDNPDLLIHPKPQAPRNVRAGCAECTPDFPLASQAEIDEIVKAR